MTSTDLKIRLQRLQCCLASKISNISNRISLGLKCEKEIAEAEIGMYIVEALRCYKVSKPNTLARTDIQLNAVTGSTTITSITINAVNIIDNSVALTVGDTEASLTAVMNEINSSSAGYSSSLYSSNILTIFSPATNPEDYNGYYPTVVASPSNASLVPPSPMSGGINGVTYTNTEINELNCLTLAQVDDIFEYSTKLCSICYAPYDSQYETIISKIPVFLLKKEAGGYLRKEDNFYLNKQ
jgi:hypothetical protein